MIDEAPLGAVLPPGRRHGLQLRVEVDPRLPV